MFPHLDPLVMKSLAERVQGCPKGHWEWQLYMRDVISVDTWHCPQAVTDAGTAGGGGLLSCLQM